MLPQDVVYDRAAGGYRLSRPPGEYPVGEILRAAEGDLCAVSCISEEKAGCGSVCDCGTRSFWQGLEAQINTYVDHYTLAQFMHSGEKSTGRSCGAEGE